MASDTLPSSAFQSLLPKLLSILQVTQRPEGTSNARNKQDLLQAVSRNHLSSSVPLLLPLYATIRRQTNLFIMHTHIQIQVFREALNHARSLATALPGGELLVEEQDEIIAMLERLREKKRCVFVMTPPNALSIYIYIYFI